MDFQQISTLYDQSKGEGEIQEHILFVLSQRREPAAVDKLMVVAKSDPISSAVRRRSFGSARRTTRAVKQFLRDLINK